MTIISCDKFPRVNSDTLFKTSHSQVEHKVAVGLDSSDVDELNLKLSEALRLSLLLKKALKELGISIGKDAGKTPIEFHTDLMKGMLEIHQRDL